MSTGIPRTRRLASDHIAASTTQNQRLEKERRSIVSKMVLVQSTRPALLPDPETPFRHP